MEAPPQFPGAPKKSKTGLILGGLALAIVLCCCGCGGLIFYFGKGVMGNAVGMLGCSMAVDQQRNAVLAFAEKNGGKLPPAANWQNAIKPYVQPFPSTDKEMPFRPPSIDDDFCDKESGTSITYNSAIAGKPPNSIKDPMGTILLFETSGRGKNKSGIYKEPPFASSPKFIMDQRRGWIHQGIQGESYIKDQSGKKAPLPKGRAGASFNVGN